MGRLPVISVKWLTCVVSRPDQAVSCTVLRTQSGLRLEPTCWQPPCWDMLEQRLAAEGMRRRGMRRCTCAARRLVSFVDKRHEVLATDTDLRRQSTKHGTRRDHRALRVPGSRATRSCAIEAEARLVVNATIHVLYSPDYVHSERRDSTTSLRLATTRV